MDNYYHKNSKAFIEDTFTCDMSEQYRFFEKYVKPNGRILDIGFGSGRDSLYFLKKGYEVVAIDPELDFINHAKEIGIKNVYLLKVEDIDFNNEFDGIWACASLLHVSSNNLKRIFDKCAKALKQNGIMYVSFKYGQYDGERNGRYYLDLNEETIKQYVDSNILCIMETKISEDVRPNKTEKWLNIIIKKK